jgi:hypothetical protein
LADRRIRHGPDQDHGGLKIVEGSLYPDIGGTSRPIEWKGPHKAVKAALTLGSKATCTSPRGLIPSPEAWIFKSSQQIEPKW